MVPQRGSFYLPWSVATTLHPPTAYTLSMHINMHYAPSNTLSTAFHNPAMHVCTQLTNTKHSWQNGTRCRDGVNVLWCHSHLVCLVFEGSIPTCICFHSENFFVTCSCCIVMVPQHGLFSVSLPHINYTGINISTR